MSLSFRTTPELAGPEAATSGPAIRIQGVTKTFGRGDDRMTALNDVDLYLSVDLRCVFAESNQLRDRTAQTQWLTRTRIVNFASPAERQWLTTASIRHPTTSVRRL